MEDKKTTTKKTPVKKAKTEGTKKTAAKTVVEKVDVKKVPKKVEIKETEKSKEEFVPKPTKGYLEAIGRRKTATARVRILTTGDKELVINDKPYKTYFTIPELQQTLTASLEKMKCIDKFKISVKVKGGGIFAQATAVRHAIARVLVKFNPDFRKRLKKAGHLTRDPRMRERKKFGLKRARRAPQWKKR